VVACSGNLKFTAETLPPRVFDLDAESWRHCNHEDPQMEITLSVTSIPTELVWWAISVWLVARKLSGD
jgi:hypothetical protein